MTEAPPICHKISVNIYSIMVGLSHYCKDWAFIF